MNQFETTNSRHFTVHPLPFIIFSRMGPTQFIAALGKGKPAAVYFLRGPDRFLHEECRKAILRPSPPRLAGGPWGKSKSGRNGSRASSEGAYKSPMWAGAPSLL